ncbi:MAG: outer membrane protein assembly factor BamD [Gemmatimonadota bacterium]
MLSYRPRPRPSGVPLLLLGLVALLNTAGCAGRDRVEALKGADHFYGECERHLEKKRYLEAIENCQRVVSNFPGSALVADAQYSLAEAYFGMKDYVSAVFEYQRLVDSYPQSHWADRAQFQIGESYYRQMRRAELDQTETYQALSSFRRFLDDNPTSPLVPEAEKRVADCRDRLGRKAYLSAHLYHRQGYLESARISYEEVLKAFPDTRWHDWATAQLGDIARQQGKLDEARRQWQEVEARTADEDLRAELRKWLAELEAQGR